MAVRTIEKNLAAVEDLLFGEVSATQTRNGTQVTVTKIDKIHPVDSLAELKTVDPLVYGKVLLLGYSSRGDQFTGHYYWEEGATDAANDVTVILSSVRSTGRWKLVSLNGISTFDSIAAAKAAPVAPGQRVVTLGHYSAGDGGGAEYLVKSAADYGATPDGYGDHAADNGNILVLRHNGTVNVKQFGAKGDNVADDTAAIQAAIDNTAGRVYIPAGKYRITSSLDLTDRFGGKTIVGEHVGIANNGSILVGETGEYAVLDIAGSQKVVLEGFGIISGSSNPSKIGILAARTTTSQYAQFNEYRSLYVNIESDPSAFGGKGTIGIIIIAAEIGTLDNVYSLADTGCAIVDSDTRWGISSAYKALGGPTSNSTYKISGNTVFDSKHEVGVPLYCKAVVNLEGMCYVNGATSETIDTYGLEAEGICSGWNFTIFSEFSKRMAKMFCTFKQSILNVMGSYNQDRYIDTTTNFTGWTDVQVNFISTITGSFTSPDYWIAGSASDVMTNVRISAPQEPAIRWVVPTNTTFNLKRGYEYSSPTKTQIMKDSVSITTSDWSDEPLKIGTYRLWVDGSGRLRIKNGAPSSDTDGVIVGTQA